MTVTIVLGDIVANVVRKRIKTIRLTVYPPAGDVRISAPDRMSLEAIRAFALSKLGWIEKQREKLRQPASEPLPEFVDRESHRVWGERFLLQVVERETAPGVELQQDRLVMQVRPGTETARKRAIVQQWQRDQIKAVVPSLIEKWEPVMGVKVADFYVRQMRTLWGSCNPKSRKIRLNSELVRKPLECLEYVVVHEMVHLLVPSHNQQFTAAMDRYMPWWRDHKDALNRWPD